MGGVFVCDVALEGRCGLILSALGLHGDDLRPVLQHEVDLTALAGVVPRGHRELPPELLQDVVFRQRAFELEVVPQQDRAVVNACHVLEQARVEQKELEMLQFVKGREWVL